MPRYRWGPEVRSNCGKNLRLDPESGMRWIYPAHSQHFWWEWYCIRALYGNMIDLSFCFHLSLDCSLYHEIYLLFVPYMMHPLICLSIRLSICLSVCLSVYLSIYLFASLLFYPFTNMRTMVVICLEVWNMRIRKIHIYIYIYICLQTRLYIYNIYIIYINMNIHIHLTAYSPLG